MSNERNFRPNVNGKTDTGKTDSKESTMWKGYRKLFAGLMAEVRQGR